MNYSVIVLNTEDVDVLKIFIFIARVTIFQSSFW